MHATHRVCIMVATDDNPGCGDPLNDRVEVIRLVDADSNLENGFVYNEALTPESSPGYHRQLIG